MPITHLDNSTLNAPQSDEGTQDEDILTGDDDTVPDDGEKPLGSDKTEFYTFFLEGQGNPPDLMGIDDDQLLAIQNDLTERLKARDEERAVTRKHFAQVSELLEPTVKETKAKVKPADKMLLLPPLFDGENPEKAKTHYERFNQHIKFQTKQGNTKDITNETIELFEHTLDKKALIWFQQHKAEFADLTTLKNMFSARYNPWGKTKREQLQSRNNLFFNPQKTDVDDHIDLLATLGNMLKQDKHAKMEKIIETMPTIIQTHLIIEPYLTEVTKKAKNLEHIIQRCDPLATAPPIITGGGAVPGLYSHITQSQDQDSDSIHKPFKSTKGKGGKKSGSKSKPQQQPQPPPPAPEEEEPYEEINNYYHNENYRGNSRGRRPYRGQPGGRRPFRRSQQWGRGQQNNYRGQYQNNHRQFNTSHGAYYNNNYYTYYQGRGGHGHVVIITEVMAADKAVIEAITITNTTNITHMMIVHRLSNMAHHAHFAVALITLPNTVLKESMT